jgi:peptidyl-prolyl cis-trans isomerase D
MLHFIREHAQGWIAWIIVGLLIIPFALWGINKYFGGGGKLVAATVNGNEISQQDFRQAFYQQRSRMQQMLGAQYDAQLFDPQIKQRVINDLVERELLMQNASDEGYRVSDQTVVATIQGIDAFRQDGVFSKSLYQQQVQAQGQTPAAFEQRVKRMILTGQLPDGLASTVFVTDAELDAAIRLQEQTRDFQYLVLPVAKYQDAGKADEAAVKAYYDQHSDRFMTEEKVQVEYVELDAAALSSDKQPSDDELREFYQANKSQFQVPEERRASHILVQVPEGADEAAVKAARAKIDDLYKKIKAGESFEKLAKENSDDPGSAEAGGDLGYFRRGIMEPDFEKAVFSLKEGEVSEPVLTSFGFHIIKLTGIRAAKSKPFAQVRDDILKQYQADATERKYFDLAEKLTNLAYETPDSLSTVAEQLGLELKKSPFFSRRGGAGIFANPRVVSTAFSDDVLHQGYNSEPIELGENHVLVLRVAEHQEARQRPLAEVQEQVKQQVIQDEAREAVKAAGEAAVKQLLAGEASDAVAKSLALEWKASADVTRSAKGVDSTVLKQAFKLSKPAAGSASYGGVVLSSGDYALIRLTKVTDGDPAAMSKEARETLKRRLAAVQASNAQLELVNTLKAPAKITINSDEL